MTSHSVDR